MHIHTSTTSTFVFLFVSCRNESIFPETQASQHMCFLCRGSGSVLECAVLSLLPIQVHIKWKKQLICIVLLGFNCCTCWLWLHLRKAFNSHGSLTKPVGVLRICRRKVLFVLLLWVTHAETYPPNPQRARDWVLSSDCWTSPFW